MHIRQRTGNDYLCKGDIICQVADKEEINIWMFDRLLPLPKNKKNNRWKDKRELQAKNLRTGRLENIPNQQYDCIGEKYKLISLIRGTKLRLLACDEEEASEPREDVELSDCTEDLQKFIEQWRDSESKSTSVPVNIGASGLLRLPTELVWQIAAMTDPKGQAALKMTCRRMRSVIPEPLIIILYECRHFIRAMAATPGKGETSTAWEEGRHVPEIVGGWDQPAELGLESSVCNSW
jgi:hypothetical protein